MKYETLKMVLFYGDTMRDRKWLDKEKNNQVERIGIFNGWRRWYPKDLQGKQEDEK